MPLSFREGEVVVVEVEVGWGFKDRGCWSEEWAAEFSTSTSMLPSFSSTAAVSESSSTTWVCTCRRSSTGVDLGLGMVLDSEVAAEDSATGLMMVPECRRRRED